VDDLSAPHRDDLKLRTVTVKATDGRKIMILGGDGPTVLDDLIRSRFVYEAVLLDEEYRRIYRLTPDGLARLIHEG
jgi:hypothetical protein